MNAPAEVQPETTPQKAFTLTEARAIAQEVAEDLQAVVFATEGEGRTPRLTRPLARRAEEGRRRLGEVGRYMAERVGVREDTELKRFWWGEAGASGICSTLRRLEIVSIALSALARCEVAPDGKGRQAMVLYDEADLIADELLTWSEQEG